MGNDKNPNQKQPGEKEDGTFHYNPGNICFPCSMSSSPHIRDFSRPFHSVSWLLGGEQTRDVPARIPLLAEIRQEKKRPGQTLFA